MSNYKKLDDFDMNWVKELIFIQIRNNLIFIKKSPWTPMSHLSPVCALDHQTPGQLHCRLIVPPSHFLNDQLRFSVIWPFSH